MNWSKPLVCAAALGLLILDIKPVQACEGSGSGGISRRGPSLAGLPISSGNCNSGGTSMGFGFSPVFAPSPGQVEAQTASRQFRLKQARLMRQAKTSKARFESAQQARAAGDIRVASKLYLRVALTRPANQYSDSARQALMELAQEGRSQLAAVEASISSGNPSEVLKELDRLASLYQNVPLVSREVGARRTRLTKQWAPVLNEAQEHLAATRSGLHSTRSNRQ